MNKIVKQILKNAGVKAQVASNQSVPKFRVNEGLLRLEGVVTTGKYSMTIKDVKGKSIDSLSVTIKDSNELANRISESLETLHKLSPIYEKHVKLNEEEEFEDLPEELDVPIEEGLHKFYTQLIELAEKTKLLCDSLKEDDAEGRSTIISFVSTLYDLAIDVDDYRSEFVEADLDDSMDESLSSKNNKKVIRKVLENLSTAEITLRGNKKLYDIKTAIKDIKAELTIRSC